MRLPAGNYIYKRSTFEREDMEDVRHDEEELKGISRRSFLQMSAITITAIGFGSFSLSGCASSTSGTSASSSATTQSIAEHVVTNLDGTKITIPADMTKVAAVFGPSYEKIVAIGCEDKIVCDGDFHMTGWPWSNMIYKDLNNVPGIENAHSNLNVEDLIGYGTQVVFCFPTAGQADSINNAGMTAVPMASTGKFHDTVDTLTLYADVFGTDDAKQRAQDYSNYYDEMVQMVKSRTASATTTPGVYLAYTDMLHGYGAKSDMVEVISIAGGKLVSTDLAGSSNIATSAEQIVQWNPDYIFVDHAGSSGNASAETAISDAIGTGEYANVTAVKKNQVYATPTGVFFWDSGIQKILYLIYIAKTIHPDLFSDVDMKTLLVDFYARFFDYSLTDDEATRILNHENPA